MIQIYTKNKTRVAAIILSLLVFIVFTPGAAIEWYKIGSGLSYDKELALAGLTHQQSTASESHKLRIDRSDRKGMIFSALMVVGNHLNILFYLTLSFIIITTPLSQTVNKKLFLLYPCFFILGAACLGFAHSMTSSLPYQGVFLGASIIWLGFTILFGILIFIGLSVRKIRIKRRIASSCL